MNSDRVLLILAAGKSSRFGGFPKAFCRFGDEYLAQKTADMASAYFGSIYVAVNDEVYPVYKDSLKGCRVIHIPTGQGDSHSFLRALRIIVKERKCDKVTLCCGDTAYLDKAVFGSAADAADMLSEDRVGVSLCSVDPDPYAWYETEGDTIRRSVFRSADNTVSSGMHDQSIFVFNTEKIIEQLGSYRTFLGIKDEEDYVNSSISKEMKLLHSFTFFYENGMLPMSWTEIQQGLSFSFNTMEEYEALKKIIA